MTQIGAADLCSLVSQPPLWELYFGLVRLAMEMGEFSHEFHEFHEWKAGR
jgi:hypothetical protein